MSHNHLEGLDNKWDLIRETQSSQIYDVTSPERVKFRINVNYTSGTNATAVIIQYGPENHLSKSTLNPIMDDLSKISLRHGQYQVIDYSLAFAKDVSDGNFSIDPDLLKAMS